MKQNTRPNAARPRRRRFRLVRRVLPFHVFLERLVLPAVLAAAVFAVGLTLSDQAARMRSLQEEEAALRSQVEELQSERARLMHMIDYAGTDAYVEQIARGTLGWVKEGETRYVFED